MPSGLSVQRGTFVGNEYCYGLLQTNKREQEAPMSTQTLLIVIILVLLLGGGGFYFR
jgi:hypothetical protein